MAAHVAFFERLLVRPIEKRDDSQSGDESPHSKDVRWGIKEVRLSADHAFCLRWLFPRAKILFLIRNPYDAFRSYAARRDAGWKWFNRWPDRPLTVNEFARHWRILVEGFFARADELDALVVRYEELAAGNYNPIEDYLGFELSREAGAVRPHDGPAPVESIAKDDLAVLDEELNELAFSMGYENGGGREPTKPEPTARAVGNTRDQKSSWHGEQDTTAAMPDASAFGSPASTRSKCVVLVPVGGQVEPACERALTTLERRGYAVRRVRGYAAIDQGRNQMATDALADGFAETIWIDSDIEFDPDDVDRLRAHGLPICCAIYPKKGKRELACRVMPGTEKIVLGRAGGLIELLYAGTGLLHVRREAYQQIERQLSPPLCNTHWPRPMLPFFQPLVIEHPRGGQWYLAEDFSFCERAQQSGLKIMADTTIRLKHIGSYGYTWEDAGTDPQRFGTYHFHISD